jgi:hypothetical protein
MSSCVSLEYTIELGKKLVVITEDGNVTMAERYECADRIALDDSRPEGSAILIHLGPAANRPSDSEIRWLAILLEELRQGVARRIAIVSEAVGLSTATHLVALSVRDEIGCVRAFESEVAARDWLML